MDINELNKVLSSEINKLRGGKAKPERVNAVTRAASQILSGARLQLTYAKMVGLPAAIPFFGRVIKPALPAPKKNGK